MRTRTRIISACLVLGAALVGGVAWATIPDAAGVINGCYRTSVDDQKGQLRVVDDPARCRSNETAIRWNERGVAGATGAAGPAGPQGATGAAGPTGPQGAKGDTGAAGADGVDGKDGADGTDGGDGAQGEACLPTNPACVGPKGDPGETGATGPPGAGATYTVRRHNSNGPSATAFCLPGEHVTGGGAYIENATGLVANSPVDAAGNAATSAEIRGWRATRSSGIDGTFAVVYVMCAS